MEEKSKKIIVIGGGLVGTLGSLFFGKKGYEVHLYESREDLRNYKGQRGRSINLAISHRGRKALREVDLEDQVLQHAVPMVGRRLHLQNGKEQSVPYDTYTNQCIYSVGRNFLNELFLTALEKFPNVKIHFGCKLIYVDLKIDELTFFSNSTKEYFQVTGDLIVGADGALSCLRRYLQLTPLFDCSQTYINHGYIELAIGPEEGRQMKPNHLHIWPRRNMMLIALPNIDKTWTATLFMPFEKFDELTSAEAVRDFFKSVFPNAIPLIGEEKIVQDFLNTQPSALISIKSSKFHYGDKYLLIGDAPHAIVPFYGQGMNAGFEDCTILGELLEKHNDNFGKILEDFTKIRVKDAHAISDLAMYNYLEMRDLVTRPSYYIRKYFDQYMHKIFEDHWQPLYYSVTFTHTPYAMCLQQRQWQTKIIKISLQLAFVIILSFLIFRII